jgi:hypothetical protein
LVFSQIQAIDQAVSWEAFDYQEFIAYRFAKRYDLAVIILSNDSTIDTQIIQRCRDLFAKHCLVVQDLSQPATGVDVVSFGFSDYMSSRLWKMTKITIQPATKYGNLIYLTINICQIGLIASFGQILNYGINFVGSGCRHNFRQLCFRNRSFKKLVLLSLIL